MAQPMHIMFAMKNILKDNLSQSAILLANEMRIRGHKVSIFYQKPIHPLAYPFYRLGHALYKLSLPEYRNTDQQCGVKKLTDIYCLQDGIDVIPYSFSDKNLKIQKLRKTIRKISPDVCICPLPGKDQLIWAVTLLGSGVPYIYSESLPPWPTENVFWNRKGRLAAMSGADAIHLCFTEYIQSLPDFLKDKVEIIPTILTLPEDLDNSIEQDEKKNFLLFTGINDLKKCRVAIDIFAVIASEFNELDLYLDVDNCDRQLISYFIDYLGLVKRIHIINKSANKKEIYRKILMCCVFSPDSEELRKAMSFGLPCITFSHYETDNLNYIALPEMELSLMTEKIRYLLKNGELRKDLGNNARKSMTACLPERVFTVWEKLFLKTAKKKGHTLMDSFTCEPFASMARMSSRARQEYAMRDFGKPFPDNSLDFKLYCLKNSIKYRVHSLFFINNSFYSGD